MNKFYKREEILFQKCLELPPEEREQFVKSSCSDDTELGESVLGLLGSSESSENFLKSLSEEDSESANVVDRLRRIAPSEESQGDQIGRYRLLELIGEGTWGSVWVAQQTEGFNRRVALKILKLGLDTKEFLARFEAERQTLAMMNHPYIAQALDAGSTDYGRPYLVMEYVKGKPLIEYADRNRLTIRERVELFIKVCEAIHYAHKIGVVHRDLKPSNILVSGRDGMPAPKIIDFGVAKTNPYCLAGKELFTSSHTFLGTPVYSSPEQLEFNGDEVDYHSDIYCLGMLLYELLAGLIPFDYDPSSSKGVADYLECVRKQDPPKPSSRFDNLSFEEKKVIAGNRRSPIAKVESAIKGDLDWIVLKCLEKEPNRRYESANHIVEELQACLDGEPVFAGAPSPLYRIRKFIARRRPPYAIWLELSLFVTIVFAVFAYLDQIGSNSTPKPFYPETAVAFTDVSIAVLPLENMSPNSENAFYVDGFHEDIITNLSKITDFLVIGRTSTLRFRDTILPLEEIGDELGVRYLLTGSVRQDQDWVQVSVQLIDVQTEAQVWAEQYRSELEDKFEIQSALTKEIAANLKENLSLDEIESIESFPTENPEAYELYRKAMRLIAETTLKGDQKIALLEEAVGLDPDFALAWAQLAIERVYWWRTNKYGNDSELLAQAYDALNEARRAKSELAVVLFAESSFSYWIDQDLEKSLDKLLEVLTIEPSFNRAKFVLGSRYQGLGRLTQAESHYESILREDPDHLSTILWLVRNYQKQGRWNSARSLLLKNLEKFPDDERWRIHLAQNKYLESGDRATFVSEIAAIEGISNSEKGVLWNALLTRDLEGALPFLKSQMAEAQNHVELIFPPFDYLSYNLYFEPRNLLSALVEFERGNRESYLVESQKTKAYWEPYLTGSQVRAPHFLTPLAICHALEGNLEAMENAIHRTRELTESKFWKYTHRAHCEMQIAIAYLITGDHERAMETLEGASHLKSQIFFQRELDSWSIFDRLRGNPRFDALVSGISYMEPSNIISTENSIGDALMEDESPSPERALSVDEVFGDSSEKFAGIKAPASENKLAYEYYLRSLSLLPPGNIELLEKAVSLDSEFAIAWRALANERIIMWRRYRNRNDAKLYKEAYDAFNQAKRLMNNSPQFLSLQAVFAFNEYDDVETAAEVMLKVHEQGAGNYGNPGGRYLQLGRLSEAQLYLEMQIRKHPLSEVAARRLFNTYVYSGSWEKAYALAGRYVSAYNDNHSLRSSFLWELAKAEYLQTGDRAALISSRSAGIGLLRSELPVGWNLEKQKVANALILRNYQDALVHLEGIDIAGRFDLFSSSRYGAINGKWSLELEPLNLLTALIQFELGNRERWLAETEKAKDYLQNILDGDPIADPHLWSMLALCHALEGNREKMEALVPVVRAKTQPENQRFRFQAQCEMHIAIAYAILGDQDEALEILEAASKFHSPIFVNRELDLWFTFDRLRGDPRFDQLLASN